jgi:hypothetical protein
VAREARRPLCCACITAQVSIGWHGAATSLVVVVVDVVACRPHWCTAHVCSTVRDPHPRPLWFRAGAAPPVPRRHTRDGTGGKRARRGPARPHGRGANAPAWCLPGSIHQRMQAVTPAPYHSTSMDGAVPDARENSSVHCTSASLATSSGIMCPPFFCTSSDSFRT